MHLVVFSYPPHARMTQICVRAARQLLPQIESVVLMWDDMHEGHAEHLAALAPRFDRVCYHSQVYPDERWGGWVRQQIVKLKVHTALAGRDFFLLDGDTVLRGDVDPWRNRKPVLAINDQLDDGLYTGFIRHLGLSCTAIPSRIFPFALFQRPYLEALHAYVGYRFGAPIEEVFTQYVRDYEPHWRDNTPPLPPFSEFAIYAHFCRAFHPGEHIEVAHSYAQCRGEDIPLAYQTQQHSIQLVGTDSEIDQQWLDSMLASDQNDGVAIAANEF